MLGGRQGKMEKGSETLDCMGGGGPDMNSAQLSLPVVNCGSDRVVEYFHIVVNSYRSQIPVSMHIFVKMLPSLEIMTGT